MSRSVVGAAAIALVWPLEARAATFDEEGSLLFDPAAAVTIDFDEDIVPDGSVASITVEDETALSGGRLLRLPPFQGVGVTFELEPSARAYRVSAWIRGAETFADVEVAYSDNAHAGVDEVAALYPTGRMTSDGWIEVANDHVHLDTTRGASMEVGFFSPSGADVDAVEIVANGSLGFEDRSGAPCAGSADPTCGPDQVCAFSQCRYVGGWVPDIPADRHDVAAYLRARLELLFGPLRNRALDLPNADLALDRMDAATTPWAFWNGFLLGIRRLHDGHTTTSGIADFTLPNERPFGVCLIEGDADRSHGVAPADPFYRDVLVSHVSPTRTYGLHPGDRIVAIDGRHPIAWARAQIEHHFGMNPTSNHATFAELAEQLRSLMARYAHEMTVVRCDAGAGTCGGLETIELDAEPVIAPDEPFEVVACDNRPLRHLSDSPANHANATGDTVYHGLVLESDATERIYGAEWESLYTTTGNDYVGPNLKALVAELKADARGAILDHRSGNGGTNVGSGILWSFAIPRRTISAYYDRAHFEDEEVDLATGLVRFQHAEAAGFADVGGSNTPTAMPVALLVTRDVSASDWLPLGMKGAAPNVKVFGPFETNGGFSTRYAFGYWLGMSYVMAVGDTFDPTGMSLNGKGVEPDILVLPKQSDLMAGRDTVYEAALAWVRQELAQ